MLRKNRSKNGSGNHQQEGGGGEKERARSIAASCGNVSDHIVMRAAGV